MCVEWHAMRGDATSDNAHDCVHMLFTDLLGNGGASYRQDKAWTLSLGSSKPKK